MNKKGSMQVYTKITGILVILLMVFSTGFSSLPVGVLQEETPDPAETPTPTEEPAPTETSENIAPAITLLEPAGDVAVTQGELLLISWQDEDPDDNALISIAFDLDNDPLNDEGHTWIVQDLEEDPDEEGDAYEWDTTDVPEGEYYLWVAIVDGVNPEIYTSTTGTIEILPGQEPAPEPTPEITPETPDCITLTLGVTAGEGTLTSETAENCDGGYLEGTVVTLNAQPAEGYVLNEWLGSDDDLSNELQNTIALTVANNLVNVSFNLPGLMISNLDPETAIESGDSFTLRINGSGFTTSSKIHWNGSNKDTTLVSPTQVETTIDALDILSPGTVSVEVKNKASEGGLSNSLDFTIESEDLYKTEASEPISKVPSATGWVTIMSEDLEGPFPVGWSVYDTNPTSGYDYWDDLSCRSYAGTWSAWAADTGDMLDCTAYDDDMNAWMKYGPFDLSDAIDAELNFYYWNNSELGCDYFHWLVSADDSSYYGFSTSGNSGGWQYQSMDLSSYVGDSSVWVAFYFESDSSITYEGAYVDNIVLRKLVSGADPIKPRGTIQDHTPTYTWTKISGATKYQFQVIKRGGTVLIDKVDKSPTCGTTSCTNTPRYYLKDSPYKWRVRSYKDGVWSPYSAQKRFYISNPFSYSFNGSKADWVTKAGTWGTTNTALYTNGTPGQYSTIYHKGSIYDDFTFTAKVKRENDTGYSNVLAVRTGVKVDPSESGLYWSYYFSYVNAGHYAVYARDKAGVLYQIQPWTPTSAIVNGGWNTLKVTASDTTFKFYINGTKVITVNNPTPKLNKGYVAFLSYKGAVDGRFLVDYATLTMPLASAAADTSAVSAEQEALNQAALRAGVTGSPEGYFGE